MHELSICQALISQVEDIIRQRPGRIERVRLGIGPLSGVEPRLLEDAYPLACAGTCAEGSQLVIEPRSIRVRCRGCGAASDAAPNCLLCAACGDWQTDLVSGDELLLLQIELDAQDDAMEVANV
jgi:hydrogenase nickel incorporation protein HypA/HybF